MIVVEKEWLIKMYINEYHKKYSIVFCFNLEYNERIG